MVVKCVCVMIAAGENICWNFDRSVVTVIVLYLLQELTALGCVGGRCASCSQADE